MIVVAERTTSPRELISPGIFARLTSQVMEDARVDIAYAECVMEQTLAFLVACAANPGSNLSPTRAVDPGWHAFILHTEDYASFCDRIAGYFIHHRPICNDDIRSGSALARTVRALKETGFPVDEELWRVDVPLALREHVRTRLGQVVPAEPSPHGSRSDLATTLHTRSGPVFVKAIRLDGPRADIRRIELKVQKHLPDLAPRLLWATDANEWLLLVFEHVAGRHADLAPGSADLSLVAEMLCDLSQTLRPHLPVLPIEKRWAPFASGSPLECSYSAV